MCNPIRIRMCSFHMTQYNTCTSTISTSILWMACHNFTRPPQSQLQDTFRLFTLAKFSETALVKFWSSKLGSRLNLGSRVILWISLTAELAAYKEIFFTSSIFSFARWPFGRQRISWDSRTDSGKLSGDKKLRANWTVDWSCQYNRKQM